MEIDEDMFDLESEIMREQEVVDEQWEEDNLYEIPDKFTKPDILKKPSELLVDCKPLTGELSRFKNPIERFGYIETNHLLINFAFIYKLVWFVKILQQLL